MASSALIRLGGLAAMDGGLLWAVKGGAILLTDLQPPVVFEAAMPLFAVGLLRLHARLDGRGRPLGKARALVACATLSSAPSSWWNRSHPSTPTRDTGLSPARCCWGAPAYKPGSSARPRVRCRSLWGWGWRDHVEQCLDLVLTGALCVARALWITIVRSGTLFEPTPKDIFEPVE